MNTNTTNTTPTLPRPSPNTRQPDPISQLTEGTDNRDATASPERFDEAADTEDADGEWVFPDPALFTANTPTTLARTRGQQRELEALTTTTPAVNVAMGIGGANTPTPTRDLRSPGQETHLGIDGTPLRTVSTPTTSALVKMCTVNPPVRTTDEIATFLQWQAGRRGEVEEQKRFRDDAAGYSQLLVFAAMRKKSPHIHLIHSVGIYPNVPGADRDWCGKCIGFLGDRTKVATPQVIELGRTTAWGWEDQVGCVDGTAMDDFFAAPTNKDKWWTPDPSIGTTKVVCPRMLALTPECVVYCAQARRTPWELSRFVAGKLSDTTEDPAQYQLLMDWCCLASQPGTGTNITSSMLSFVTPAVLGTTEHFHSWAHSRLLATLGPVEEATTSDEQRNNRVEDAVRRVGVNAGQLDVSMIAQVTAAVVAALRAETQGENGVGADRQPKTSDAPKPLSEYQLAKLKGFSCVRSEASLQPIWSYFRSTKEVDAQRTQLLEEMRKWARNHDVQLNRSVYFEKATMDDITKLEFGPGTPTAYLNTAEQGISILTCRPRMGNETADLRSKEHAVDSTLRNHTLAEALLLGKRDPRPPASTFHELKLDLVTFCALLWVLFGEKCDFFDNCYALFTMLDSESVTANSHNFTPTICRHITWAILNDSRQYFFRTVTVDSFSSGQVRWPTSLLMQVIGADVHACREIAMGNFPAKWLPVLHSGAGNKAVGQTARGADFSHISSFPPAGLPPAPTMNTWSPAGVPTSTTGERALATPADRPVHIRQSDIHPTIKALMSPYITHFRSVQFRNLLRAANVTEQALPTLPQFNSSGRNNLCYSYILGKCQGRACGRMNVGHAQATALPNDFVQALCSMLAPGVEKRLATEPPTTQQAYQATNQAKRWKRSA